MQKQHIYQDLAPYYDLLYRWKNYEKEAKKLIHLIHKYKKTEGNILLDVGCVTGRHLKYLQSSFICKGIDLHDEMLQMAREKISNVIFEKADMTNFDFNETYDVITCLFSGIGCVKTYSNIVKVIKNFAKHLNLGGVVIIEPWHTKTSYKVGLLHTTTFEKKDLKIVQMNISKMKGKFSVIEMHYLIGEKGKAIKHIVDYDTEGLFEVDKVLKIMKKAGFQAIYLRSGLSRDDVGTDRGLYIGVKK